jgi:DNA-binding GntR family transcriptional regulator
MINQKSLSQQVKDHIKFQIEKRILRPGDRINEKLLCQTLGLSRTPVREAIIQLSIEGIVEVLPRRFIQVKKHTLKDIRNLYTIISALEADAAETFIDNVTQEDIANQEKLYDKMKMALDEDNYQKYKELNELSHKMFIDKMNNEILSELLANLKKRFFDFPLILSGIPEWLDLMLSDHYKMIQLLKNKDKAGIRKLIKEHWSYERNIRFGIDAGGPVP